MGFIVGAVKTLARGLLNLFVSLLVAVVLLELVCALYYFSQYGYSRPPWFGGAPLTTSRYLESFDFDPITLYAHADTRLNEALYAKEKIPLPPKASDEYRVFLVGGSTVANLRMPPGERIVDYMQAVLKPPGRQARVYNFGVPSYASYNELELIVGKLVHLQPDMIIVYDGANDIFYSSVIRREIWVSNLTDVMLHYRRRFTEDIQHQMNVVQRINYLLDAVSYTKYVAQKIAWAKETAEIEAMSQQTARQFADALAATRDKACQAAMPLVHTSNPTFADEATINEAALDAYILNLAAMAEAAAEKGIAFVHVLQPQAITKRKLYPCEKYSIDLNNFLYRDHSEVTIASYELVREKLRKLQVRRTGKNELFTDMSRFTDDMDIYLYDDTMHAWRRGPLTKLVGEEIARRVAPLLH